MRSALLYRRLRPFGSGELTAEPLAEELRMRGIGRTEHNEIALIVPEGPNRARASNAYVNQATDVDRLPESYAKFFLFRRF
jgi:hypothetical protein